MDYKPLTKWDAHQVFSAGDMYVWHIHLIKLATFPIFVAEPFALLVQSSFFFVQTQFSLAMSPYCLLKSLNFQVTSPIFMICTTTLSQRKVSANESCIINVNSTFNWSLVFTCQFSNSIDSPTTPKRSAPRASPRTAVLFGPWWSVPRCGLEDRTKILGAQKKQAGAR